MPVLVTDPVLPPFTKIPVALSMSVKPIAPSLLTVLLLFSVTAAPEAVTPMDPAEVMSILAGAFDTAVAVATGVLVDVEIESWAEACPARASRGALATAATRIVRFMESELSRAE